ncbi:MAG: 4Fe-4S dicluster domain-containing protein [Armatimonadota bacterium]|nr:4Fe-4S dicluster domain-containing protein [Armatimonadota bacterium]
MTGGEGYVLPAADLTQLLDALARRGYVLVGPTVREAAIVYDRIRSAADLPVGLTDEQEAGRYRLRPRQDAAYFGYAVGPHSWKRFLHPPERLLWKAVRDDQAFRLEVSPPDGVRYAFVGVRACELAALQVLDRVFSGGPYVDALYRTRREDSFVVAVHCGQAGGTCFCASMGTGPHCAGGYDLALTEILEGEHRFYLEVGTSRGEEVRREVPCREATEEDRQAAARAVAQAVSQMGRQLDTSNLRDLLVRNLEHPRWDEVAGRCLSCGNCTLVCPTCFCFTVEDTTDLSGEVAERRARWDSCFTLGFSYLHGGSVRSTVRARYRQWLTHKLATWWDQFGTSGCVGCGRCITWCPVGIDLTEEVAAIRLTDGARAAEGSVEGA